MSINTKFDDVTNSNITFEYLRKMNIIAMILHLVQGLLMLVLGIALLEFERDLYTFYINASIIGEEITFYIDPEIIFTLADVGPLIASFLLLSAIAHFLIAYPLRESYENNLKKHSNPLRWFEYALSSSVMIVFIAILFGIWSFWTLFMIFILNAIMNLMGWMMEKHNQTTEKTDWTAYRIGVLAGIAPWLLLFSVFFLGPAQPPDFVFWIFVTQFLLFFFGFAMNMFLQYQKIGPWKDYLFGERGYIILSLVAKTLLAWFVFIGIFQPG